MAKESIGSLWVKKGKNGEAFFSGRIMQTNGVPMNIVVFSNDKGGVEKRPDYRIFLSEPREDRQPSMNSGEAPF